MIVSWKDIAKQPNLSEEFMREHKEHLNWKHISLYQDLSEKFIGEMHAFVDWNCISSFQPLSENFINNYQHKVNWDMISLNQQLSRSYIENHLSSIDFKGIKHNLKLSLTKEELYELEKEYIQHWKHAISFKIINNNTKKTFSIHFTHKFFPQTSYFYEIFIHMQQENNTISYYFKAKDVKGFQHSHVLSKHLFSSTKEETIFEYLFTDFLLSEKIITVPIPLINKADKKQDTRQRT